MHLKIDAYLYITELTGLACVIHEQKELHIARVISLYMNLGNNNTQLRIIRFGSFKQLKPNNFNIQEALCLDNIRGILPLNES